MVNVYQTLNFGKTSEHSGIITIHDPGPKTSSKPRH